MTPFSIRTLVATLVVLFGYLTVAILLAGCPKTPKPPVIPPGEATCEDVCVHYTALGCPISTPTANGFTCVDVCHEVQDSGVLTWDLGCRIRAESCRDADDCEIGR